MLINNSKENITYLVGFLAGDGNFCSGWGKRKDRLSVTTTDESFVDWCSENVIEFSKENPRFNNNKKLNIIAKLPAYVKTFPANWMGFLKNYGILSKKEERSCVNIQKKYMGYWLLGLFDADGCVSYSFRKDRDRICAKVSYTHPSVKLLSYVQKFLTDELDISSRISPKGTEKCYTLEFSKIDSVLKFCDYIYSTKFVVIPRKYDKYQNLKNEIKKRRELGISYPAEFTKTWDYRSLVGSRGRNVYLCEGKEYSSVSNASSSLGVSKSVIRNRCNKRTNDWSSRPKTQTEVDKDKKDMDKKIRKLFREWEKLQ